MLIIPAIDLKDGKCVRLRQGHMDDATVFSDNPVDIARHWVDKGARRLHLIDLDGAVSGKPVNGHIVRAIAHEFPELPIQLGGGIRDMETIESYLEAGIDYVILGTAAVENPTLVEEACRHFKGHIIVGIDANNNLVATNGWEQVTKIKATDLAERCTNDGIAAIIYTDIERDGMMQGANIAATAALAKVSSIPVIASGGINSLKDIRSLMSIAHEGILGAITGRAIYENKLKIEDAQQLCDGLITA